MFIPMWIIVIIMVFLFITSSISIISMMIADKIEGS